MLRAVIAMTDSTSHAQKWNDLNLVPPGTRQRQTFERFVICFSVGYQADFTLVKASCFCTRLQHLSYTISSHTTL